MTATVQHDGEVDRGRSRSRYPSHLTPDGVGKKPYLHRRGTSKTLESLEDLLREAGYKETRVFSAEPEAILDAASQSSRMSAVVGFISNFMPLSTRSLGRAAGVAVANATTPTVRIDSSPSRAASRNKSSRDVSPACQSTSSSVTIRPGDALLPPPRFRREATARSSAIVHTSVAHLRHAASSPTLTRSKSHSSPRRKRMVMPPHPVPPVPPIPDTWITVLAKALARPPSSPLGDRTNSGNFSATPLQIRRPSPALGTVSRTNVTCRSTPASRSSSVAPPPLLTVTRADNDVWAAPSPDASFTTQAGDDSLMDDEDDSDGEVNLARILVPRSLARRQRSIVSLRRNLQTSMTQAIEERRTRAGSDRTWGPSEFDDEGFPIVVSAAPAQQRPGKKRRRAIPSWGPEDI